MTPVTLVPKKNERDRVHHRRGLGAAPGYPHFSRPRSSSTATEGALLIDDSHRDIVLNTMSKGMVLRSPHARRAGRPRLSGPDAGGDHHFIEAVALDRPVLVTPNGAPGHGSDARR